MLQGTALYLKPSFNFYFFRECMCWSAGWEGQRENPKQAPAQRGAFQGSVS